MKTKSEIFKNALNLSAEELNEAVKVKEHICRILEKDLRINYVSVGFAFMQISVYTNYTDYTYRLKQDGTAYIETSFGLIQVTNEIGVVLLNEIREKKQNNKYIDLRILL